VQEREYQDDVRVVFFFHLSRTAAVLPGLSLLSFFFFFIRAEQLLSPRGAQCFYICVALGASRSFPLFLAHLFSIGSFCSPSKSPWLRLPLHIALLSRC
jgi:hypothetical protein